MKVLHILSGLDGGGAGKIAYDYSLQISPRAHFDFVVTTHSIGIRERELKDRGYNVFHVKQMRENLFEHYKQLEDIMKKGKYDIVHIHWGYKSIFALIAAKKSKITVRISHSHIAYEPESILNKIVRKLITPIVKVLSTSLFACGEDASIWTWGKQKEKKKKVYIMTNAIEVQRYAFSNSERSAIRKELQIEDKLVFGNIARFSYQKNNLYLIDVFREIKMKCEDAVLVLIGRGELEQEIKNRVKEYGLERDVLFLGILLDANRYYSAMDIFILPSRFEGLPVVLVECQANGLPAYVSNSITKEIKLSDKIRYLNINEKPEYWADRILESDNSRYGNEIKNSKYDITEAAKALWIEYDNLLSRNNKYE